MAGLDTKSFIERCFTQIIIEMATHPEEYDEAVRSYMETPIFNRMFRRVTNKDEDYTP